MSTHQVKVSESHEKGKDKEVTTQVTDEKNSKTEKTNGKDEAVLAKVNNDSKKDTK